MADSEPRAKPTLLRRAVPWLILAALTAYAGFSRFFMLGHPTLWGDEIATYYRVAGDFDHLMNRLRNDGFVPLHYIAYWWLGQHVTLTPFWMRFIPALCGTLTVPAVFLLARQLFAQKTALVAAALAAASAWLMTYARDAKMYADTWLFVTLGLALLLWWLRQTGWWSLVCWPGWVVCASLSVWLHATAILVVLAYPAALLLRLPEHRWYQKDLLILGILVVLAGPWWYYTQYNSYVERTGIFIVDQIEPSHDRISWNRSGLTWVEQHNEGQSPWQLALNTASSVLVGIQWPRQGHQDPWNYTVQPARWFAITAAVVMSAVLGMPALAALPWPQRWRGGCPAAARDDPDIIRRNPWRAAALLGVLTVLPVYGFYCRSFDSFDAPWHWLADWRIVTGAAVALLFYVGVTVWRARTHALVPVLRGLAPVVIVLLGMAVVYAAMHLLHARAMDKDPGGGAWQSVWMPRYAGIIGPAALVAAAALLMRLPTRPLRIGAIALLLALNLTQGWARLAVDTEPPYDLLARDLIDGRADGATTRTVFNIPGNGGLTGRWDDRGRVAYYLAAHTAFEAGDRGLNQGKMHDTYWASADLSPDALRDAMDKYPGVERLVVWERFEPDTPTDALDGEDPYLAALGNGWSILAKRRYELRQFWNWRWLGWMRRTVYQRDTAASAPPSDGAAP